MSGHQEQPRIHEAPRAFTERYECKYGLTEQQAAQLKHYIAAHVALDPHAKKKGGSYRISSLYLDSPDLQLQRSAIEGQRDRYKLRVRVYANDPERKAFLEVKHRRNSLISKTRAQVPQSLVPALLARSTVPDLQGHRDQAALDDFLHRIRILNAQPVVLVRYNREAYAGIEDRTARVTFDRQIMSSASDEMSVRCEGPGWNTIPNHRTLLELKFTGRCPVWMANAIDRLELQRVSFSKYAQAVITEDRNGMQMMG